MSILCKSSYFKSQSCRVNIVLCWLILREVRIVKVTPKEDLITVLNQARLDFRKAFGFCSLSKVSINKLKRKQNKTKQNINNSECRESVLGRK